VRRGAGAFAGALLIASVAQAAPQNEIAVDRTIARFYAAELGGAAQPQFISERVLAFEARLELMSREGGAPSDPLEERHYRSALELHVSQELLARTPLDRRPTAEEIVRTQDQLRAAVEQRAGGTAPVLLAAAREGLSPGEIDEVFRRQALAALAIDRAISPVLTPSEDQLREVYRTAAHPFRNVRFEDARDGLTLWFVEERLRVLESSLLTANRSRVTITLVSPPRH
jgi:hypothetical protein